MKPLFVAISGKKSSGKDELSKWIAHYLELDHKLHVEITHFADPLKEMCIQLFGLDRNLVYGSNADKDTLTKVMWDGFPEKVRAKYGYLESTAEKDGWITENLIPRSGPMTHRELLQVIGTDIFRERVYSNIWAEYPFKQKWEQYDQGDICILTDIVFISDCRFPNEVTETLKNGGLVIRINRNTGNTDAHASETALDDYDWDQANHFMIDNNAPLDELTVKANKMAALIVANYMEKK